MVEGKSAGCLVAALLASGAFGGIPANDECGDAAPVAVPSVTAGTTTNATFDDVGLCGTANTAPGVWFSVTGTGNALVASTCDAPGSGGSGSYDTKISVFAGDCADFICIAGSDDDCAGGSSATLSEVAWCSASGQSYLILVHGFSTDTGDFELSISDGGACAEAACCLNDGTCLTVNANDCASQGGEFQGDLSDCLSVTCPQSITSTDGAWVAGLDEFGQVIDLFPKGQPTEDNLFETLVYEASGGQLTRRVEDAYTVGIGPIVDQGRTHSFTRLEESGGDLAVEIENSMVGNPDGGVLIRVSLINGGPSATSAKLVIYCDLDISATSTDDDAGTILDTGDLLAIEQFDADPVANPLWFGGCAAYKSWEIGLFSDLRTALDDGVSQLGSVDGTVPLEPDDHTCALSSGEMVLSPGQSLSMQVGIGAPGLDACIRAPCPWDCGAPATGTLEIGDLLALLGQYDVDAPFTCAGGSCDFDGNGCVDVQDLLKLIGNWVVGCP